MKLLCLAEKPSVARELESVYKKHKYKHDIDFDAFHGHLMKLPNADYYNPKFKNWELDDLPIIPDFKYVQNDEDSCKRLLKKIKSGRYDGLINACDSGREGELIFYSFYEGNHLSLPVLRLWASDVTEETLSKALDNLIDPKQLKGLREASKLRAEFDWLVGINLSRAATITSSGKLPVGRVQSPVLNLIVERENEIKNFVPKDFFEIKAQFKTESGELYNGTYLIPPEFKGMKFDTKEEAEAAFAKVQDNGKILSIDETKQTINPPSLCSLVEVQKDAAQYFGYRADLTLNILQSLYETHKLLTYPRTDSRFLPTAMIKEIAYHVKPVEAIPELEPYAKAVTQARMDQVMKSKSYVDNAKIVDHHAIIPTKIVGDLSKLSDQEKNIYILVCKRFLSIFMDPFVAMKTVVVTETEDGARFRSTGKIVKDPGYSVLYPVSVKDVLLPQLKKDDTVTKEKSGIIAKQTKPPVRYNTKTLLEAMQNIGQKLSSAQMRQILRDTAGLGTSATRAEILKKIEHYGFVVVNKQTFIPTEFGMAVCKNYGSFDVFSAELTAKWEDKLKKVEDMTMDPDDFRKEMLDYVQDVTDAMKKVNCSLKYMTFPIVGTCPSCGKPVRSATNYFICEDYKNGDHPCNICFPKSILNHKISDKEMTQLLEGKHTKPIKFDHNGKQWSCPIVIKNGKLTFYHENYADSSEEVLRAEDIDDENKIGICPCCGGTIYESKNYFLCSNKVEKGCKFQVSKKILGTEIKREDAKDLIESGRTKEKWFTWKSGKKGKAYLYRTGSDVKFGFNNKH